MTRIVVRLFLTFFIVFFLVFFFLSLPDNRLHLYFCPVGEGDALLVTQGTVQILIDAGPPRSWPRLLSCLQQAMPFWDRTIELAINTHPEADHLAGFIPLLDRYRVAVFAHNGWENKNSWYFEKLKRKLFVSKSCTIKLAYPDRFRIGRIYFDTLWPRRETSFLTKGQRTFFFNQKTKCSPPHFRSLSESGFRKANQGSLVLRLRFGRFRALFLGDLPALEEKILVWRRLISPVEVVKIAHHGSQTSTTPELLQVAQPQLAVISVGSNRFGHPHQAVLQRLQQNMIKVLRTDKNGLIEIISDGQRWWYRSTP